MNDGTIYSHIQLSPGDIIHINVAPDEEMRLLVVGIDDETKRLILTDGTFRFISQWSLFIKDGEIFRPLNE